MVITIIINIVMWYLGVNVNSITWYTYKWKRFVEVCIKTTTEQPEVLSPSSSHNQYGDVSGFAGSSSTNDSIERRSVSFAMPAFKSPLIAKELSKI